MWIIWLRLTQMKDRQGSYEKLACFSSCGKPFQAQEWGHMEPKFNKQIMQHKSLYTVKLNTISKHKCHVFSQSPHFITLTYFIQSCHGPYHHCKQVFFPGLKVLNQTRFIQKHIEPVKSPKAPSLLTSPLITNPVSVNPSQRKIKTPYLKTPNYNKLQPSF